MHSAVTYLILIDMYPLFKKKLPYYYKEMGTFSFMLLYWKSVTSIISLSGGPFIDYMYLGVRYR